MPKDSLQVSLFGNMNYEKWRSPSMERYLSELEKGLIQKGVTVETIQPTLPLLYKFLPSQYQFRLVRFNYYPSLAKHKQRAINHVTDHSYAQVAKYLDPNRTIITCHDLIPLFYEKDTSSLKNFRESVSYMNKVRLILADSEDSRKDLVSQLKIDPSKIKVVYLGVEERFHPSTTEKVKRFKEKYSLPQKPLLLHLGNNLAYKNIERILLSLRILNQKGIDFYFLKVGSDFTSEQKELIREYKIGDSVRFLGVVPEDQLPDLYSSIDLLVYPSLKEGFGFPVLETLACGKRVLISKGTSLEEIASQAGVYVDQNKPEDIARGMEKVLSMSMKEKDKLRRLGLERTKLFSWEKTVDQVYKYYLEILNA